MIKASTSILKTLMLILMSIAMMSCASYQTDQPIIVSTSINHDSPGGIGGTGRVDQEKNAQSGGIGGTGKTGSDEGGIGGTGYLADHPTEQGGIGGTGRHDDPKLVVDNGLGGTGIVGTITEFGSIWVNNAHIHFNDKTPVTINLKPANQEDLRLGQVVAVLSDKDDEEYQARSIDIVHEVVGPLTRIDSEQGLVEAMQQRALITTDTRITLNDTQLIEPDLSILEQQLKDKTQSWVKVSGHRREDGTIRATRIDFLNLELPEQVQVIGKLVQSTRDYLIAGVPVRIDDWLVPEKTEGRILVNGYLENGVFVAENVGQDSTQLILEIASDILIEGFVYATDIEDMVEIGGFEIELDDQLMDDMFEEYDMDDLPVQIFGIIDDEQDIDIEEFLYFSEEDDEFIEIFEDEFDHFDDHEFEEYEDYEFEEFYDEYLEEMEEFEDFDVEAFEEYFEEEFEDEEEF